MGVNDGIVSVAALLIGVIATGAGDKAILMAGLAATIAGAVSMALGEFVSVSAQRDSEQFWVAKERQELREAPEEELEEVAGILSGYGINRDTALEAAQEIHKEDALRAHLQLELGIDEKRADQCMGRSVLLRAVLPGWRGTADGCGVPGSSRHTSLGGHHSDDVLVGANWSNLGEDRRHERGSLSGPPGHRWWPGPDTDLWRGRAVWWRGLRGTQLRGGSRGIGPSEGVCRTLSEDRHGA